MGAAPISRPALTLAGDAPTLVVVDAAAADPARNAAWTLRCDPTGGTHPDAQAACRDLLRAKNPFAPIPHGSGQTILREALLVADHNAYHLGQLIVVRRALGAWAGD